MKILNYKNDKMTNPSQPPLTKGRRVAFTKPSRGAKISPRPLWERVEFLMSFANYRIRVRGKKAAFTLAEGATHVDTCDGKRKIAFTLAEVLITLGIIGVVAAMTLPTLIQNHQKRSLEVATQKFYSTMSQAVKKYMADEGVDDLRNTPLASDNYEDYDSPEAIASIRNFVTKYLKVVEECDHEANNCFAPTYKNWIGEAPSDDNYGNFTTIANRDERRDYVLADGAVIRIGYHFEGNPISLFVDVNGKKGPNRVGYDLWEMDIYYDGTIDETNIGVYIDCVKYDHLESWCGGEKPDFTTTSIRNERFVHCTEDLAYGGCFGHFLENNFKFDY